MAVDSEGRRFWRSLEEYLDTPEFQEMLHREFPEQASEWTNPLTRRSFLTLMGASLALMGLNGCSTQPAPREKIMPYVRQPEGIVPGKKMYFATAMPLAGVATGLLVESHEGRPTKIDGNPLHPGSPAASHEDAEVGSSDLLMQAAILGLYDPDRSQGVTYRGQPRAWNEMLSALRRDLDKLKKQGGEGLCILTETVGSPTLAAQLNELLDSEHFPKAKWYQYEPANRSNVLEGAKLAFGEYFNTHYDFTKADIVLSLDADFLLSGPGTLRYTRDFASRRRVRTRETELSDMKMNRLYVVECDMSNTGAVADHRLALRTSDIEPFAQLLAVELKVPDARLPVEQHESRVGPSLPKEVGRWLKPLADDLRKHEGKCLVIAGDGQPASLHALVHAINHSLKNIGQTVKHTAPIEAKPVDHGEQIKELVEDMAERRVKMLVILGGNPVYTAPIDLKFAEHLRKVPLRLHLGLYHDETAALCDWHIPEAHFLESWSDGCAYDLTLSIIQPLIAPLYNGRTAHEMLAAFTESPERAGLEIVREHWRDWWKQQKLSGNFDEFWRRSLQEGVLADIVFPDRDLAPKAGWAERAANRQRKLPGSDAKKLEIVFRPDPTLFDGRFANNGWLQELPKPVTKLTWDNAAILSPKTAEKLGIAAGNIRHASGRPGASGGEHGHAVVDVIELSYRGRTLKAPVWIQPGHADDSVTIHLGHGRWRGGRVASGVGFNAYALRTNEAPWFDDGLEVRKFPGETHVLACTQMHHNMEERAPIRTKPLAYFQKHPHFADELTASETEKPDVLAQIPGPEPRGRAEKKLEEERKKDPDKDRLIPLTLYEEAAKDFEEENKRSKNYQWGMAIDLTTCTGCSACVVACQSENNIPVVGKEEVTRGREMHWIRLDRYYGGEPFDANRVSAHFQPVPCMHCEKAPCELVCPVGATVHSHDGLNDMVYNRCVGTRYCSNNCPYKVRRFNFLQFADYTTTSLKLMHNPEVTVRSRGVMEKCTYCVQRIRAADIEAEREGRRIEDHHLMTACQAACPAGAIVFGDINNPKSAVYQLKNEPTNYALLAGLNTQPRTTYLAALRNPNPELTSPLRNR